MGKAHIFGDDISTDLLAPGNHLKLPPEELVKHCMTAVDPTFVTRAKPGDVLVAGRNFGQGSSREQAVESLQLLGISVLLAKSFARIFYRNAFNLGMAAIPFDEADEISAGDDVSVDIKAGLIVNHTTGERYTVAPVPQHLLDIIEAGGLMAQLKQQFSKAS